MNKLIILAGVAALGASASAIPFGYSGPGGAIPDNAPAGVQFNIVVAGTGLVVQSVDMVDTFNFSHTWVGDLMVRFGKMGGPEVVLFERPGTGTFGWDSDLSGNYSFNGTTLNPKLAEVANQNPVPQGLYRAAGNTGTGATTGGTNPNLADFGVFNGVGLDGTWYLLVSDHAGGDIGGIESWGFSGTAVPEPATMLAIGAGLVGLAARRRKK